MKPYRSALILVVLMLAAAFALVAADKAPDSKTAPKADAVQPATSGIPWVSYDEGLKRAEAENKYLLVDITASWCGWCKKMEKETFTDTSIINMIKDKYIPVKLWGDSDKLLDINGYKISEKDLVASKFGPSGYPTFVFMCSDSLGIAKVPGYKGPAEFMQMLTVVNTLDCDSLRTVQKQQGQPGQQQPQGN